MDVREFITKQGSPLDAYRHCAEQYLTTGDERPIRSLSDEELGALLERLYEQKNNAQQAFAHSIQAVKRRQMGADTILQQATNAVIAAVQLIAIVTFELERRAKIISILM